jgi:hypothetical protein
MSDEFLEKEIEAAIEAVSKQGQYFFTKAQLQQMLWRQTRPRRELGSFGIILLFIDAIFAGFVLAQFLGLRFSNTFVNPENDFSIRFMISMSVGIILAVVNYYYFTVGILTTSYLRYTLENALAAYLEKHTPEKLATGKRLESMQALPPDLQAELADYAPDRILIVEGDDVTEMLILNHFHFNYRTLVVSADKYPYPIFEAARRIIQTHTEVPVFLLRSASEKGRSLLQQLRRDSNWCLQDKVVTDLGLFDELVDKIPYRAAFLPRGKYRPELTMPPDFAPPAMYLTYIGLAATGNLILMSDTFLAESRLLMEQRKNEEGGGSGG